MARIKSNCYTKGKFDRKNWRNGKEFRVIREKINNNNCNKCNYFNICHGGCRIFDINAKECVH